MMKLSEVAKSYGMRINKTKTKVMKIGKEEMSKCRLTLMARHWSRSASLNTQKLYSQKMDATKNR